MGATLDALRPILALLRHGIGTDEDARELTSLLAPLIRIDAVGIGTPAEADWAFAKNVPDSWLAKYGQVSTDDPSIPFLRSSPLGTWWFGERAIDEPSRHTEFMALFHDAALHDVAIARLYSPFRDDLVLVLYRAAGRADFGDDERLILELLYPHLASALASRRALAHAREHPNAPTVEISFPTGRVEVPAKTWRFLGDRLGPIGRDGRAKVERAILAATRRFTSANIGGRSQRIFPDLRLELAALAPGRGESARLHGTFLDERAMPIAAPEPAVSPIEALLTPRERTIARLAASGASVATIAEGERVGVETVRTHLRAVYRKLGVRSRAELARQLSAR